MVDFLIVVLKELVDAVTWFLPAIGADMAPTWFKARGKTPMDFGKKFSDGKRILGDHKTWKGFFVGTIVGTIVGLLQELVFNRPNGILIGLLMGFGTMSGDAVKSFFKRRLNIKPGARFWPWDQYDFVIGSILLSSLVQIPKLSWVIIVFVFTPIIHHIFTTFEHRLGLAEHPW